MTTTPNYAEALQREAYSLARYKLTKVVPPGDRLDAIVTRLDAIHARNMDQAAEWTTPQRPGSHGRELTEADVNLVAVIPLAGGLLAEALAD